MESQTTLEAEHESLDIVDEHDTVIGIAPRQTVHQDGLLHREVHCMFVTPSGQCILQRRGAHVETYPNRLDVTVGGHVQHGSSYEATVRKECKEETGITPGAHELVALCKIRSTSHDGETGRINNVWRMLYAARFTGSVDDLIPEKETVTTFVAVPFSQIEHCSGAAVHEYTPGLLVPESVAALKAFIATHCAETIS